MDWRTYPVLPSAHSCRCGPRRAGSMNLLLHRPQKVFASRCSVNEFMSWHFVSPPGERVSLASLCVVPNFAMLAIRTHPPMHTCHVLSKVNTCAKKKKVKATFTKVQPDVAMSNESTAWGSTGVVPMQVDAVLDVGGKAKDGEETGKT